MGGNKLDNIIQNNNYKLAPSSGKVPRPAKDSDSDGFLRSRYGYGSEDRGVRGVLREGALLTFTSLFSFTRSNSTFDYQLRVIVVGDSTVGKTSMLRSILKRHTKQWTIGPAERMNRAD